MAATVEVGLGSWWCLCPEQIRGDGSRSEFGPSTRPGGISSSCIGEVHPKQIHGIGRVKFECYLAASVVSALAKPSKDSYGPSAMLLCTISADVQNI
eukprot:g34723.t1